MKKRMAVLLAAAMSLCLAGCQGGEEQVQTSAAAAADTGAAADTSAAADGKTEQAAEAGGEKITLTAFMSLGQWADHIDELTAAYVAEHPNIETIEWELPSSSTATDLLKAKLAADEMPDVFGVNYGESTIQWAPHLMALDDMVDELKPYYSESDFDCGYYEGSFYHVPLIAEGYGILYNMKYLEQAGWDKTPETFDELEQLCEDLTAAGIQPFVNHYKEDKLTLTYHYGMVPAMIKDAPFDYVEDLKAGKDMDIVNDADWNAMVDFYDLTMKYGNADALTTDKQTARNDFFTEKAAMITDEGSWELANIRSINPALEEYVVQSFVPLTNDASRNKLSMDLISICVSNTTKYPEEAKELVRWLGTSEAAMEWYMKQMGSLPASIKADSSPENVGVLSAQVKELNEAGRAATSLQAYVPETVRSGIGELWSLYLAGEIDRTQLLTDFAKLWTDYAENQ